MYAIYIHICTLDLERS
ncbi:hypothetical protein CAJAP_05147 [Camponotus japonicus]